MSLYSLKGSDCSLFVKIYSSLKYTFVFLANTYIDLECNSVKFNEYFFVSYGKKRLF